MNYFEQSQIEEHRFVEMNHEVLPCWPNMIVFPGKPYDQ